MITALLILVTLLILKHHQSNINMSLERLGLREKYFQMFLRAHIHTEENIEKAFDTTVNIYAKSK